MSTLYLCAAGNPEGVRLAVEVNEHRRRWERIVLLDDDPAKLGQTILGIPVIGPFTALADHQAGDEAVNLVARTTRGRDAARSRIEGFGIALTSLVHPALNLRAATIGHAVTLYEGCTISALSTVGDHAVIFTRAVLGHGATIGAGAVLAPGAVVNARVRVGARAYIGTNAAVLPDLSVGEEATVSACSAVVGDVPPGCTALGVPAEIMGGAAAAPLSDRPEIDVAAALDKVRAVFAGILGVASIGGDDNFFDAGGNSQRAVEMQVALKKALGVPVTIVDIFRSPTPRHLVNHLFATSGTSCRPTRADLRRRRFERG